MDSSQSPAAGGNGTLISQTNDTAASAGADDPMQKLNQVSNSIQKTLGLIHQLYLTVSTFNAAFQMPLLQRINGLVAELDNMVKLAEKCNIQVPMEVVNLIDDGKNPDEFTRDILNNCIAKNQITKGKTDALKGLRKNLLEELEQNFPDEVETFRESRAASAAELKRLAQEEWVYVIKRDREGKISLHAFDPIYQIWQSLPPVPGEYSEALGFGCAVLSGCHLYLFGGRDPLKGSMRRVIFYNARTNKWHRAPDMLRKRHLFGSCVINNCLYVAGGECKGIQRTLRSAEVYDPNRNRWSFISEMTTAMVPFIGVIHNGTWLLKGLGSNRNVICESYSQETDTWTPVSNGMVNGWRNPSISLNGQLYALDCQDGCKLKVYDGATDSWKKFIDSRLHLGSSRALDAAALVSLNGKLCIIRNNMSISLVDVSSPNKRVESNPHLWENIAGKGPARSLVRNLWSTIAGRSGLKSHIVHCQVLQA